MRFIHLADTHLGFRQFSGKLDPERRLNQRECDVYGVWHQAIGIAIEREVDAVIHAGDMFDSARPSPRALSEALDGISRLRDSGIPLVAIAGNHSTPRFRSGGFVFEVLERFGVQAAWQEPHTFLIGGVAFHAVPHEPDGALLQDDIRAARPDPNVDANVLVLHAGLDAVPAAGYGEVNPITVASDLLVEAPFDYIAMGHLHRFQAPQINAIYPGSLERLDFADLEGDKAVVEIDLAVKPGTPGFVTRHKLDARPMFDLKVGCEGCDQATIIARLEQQLSGVELDGAVVRVRLEELHRDVWGGLDFDRFDEIFADCLHHAIHVGRSGLRAAPGGAGESAELQFESWARSRVPQGLDPERVIGIAQRHLQDAAVAEAERDSE